MLILYYEIVRFEGLKFKPFLSVNILEHGLPSLATSMLPKKIGLSIR